MQNHSLRIEEVSKIMLPPTLFSFTNQPLCVVLTFHNIITMWIFHRTPAPLAHRLQCVLGVSWHSRVELPLFLWEIWCISWMKHGGKERWDNLVIKEAEGHLEMVMRSHFYTQSWNNIWQVTKNVCLSCSVSHLLGGWYCFKIGSWNLISIEAAIWLSRS